MKKFILTLGTERSQDVVFDILESDIANLWALEIDKNYELYETDRFKCWPNDNKDLNYFFTNLKNEIDIVNNYKPKMIDIIEKDIDQNSLNYLHKLFEDLRGPIESGTVFFNNSPNNVKNAINRFNLLIHECEHFIRDYGNPTIVGTYKNRPRYPLRDTDYDLFTFQWKFGYVYINYCEVGKPLLDIFKDNDDIVGDDNVRPLEFYSADFMIKFGPDTPNQYYQQRLVNFHKWFKRQNYKFNHLSLGLIPVAKLNYIESGFKNYTNLEIINNLSNHLKIKATCIQ